MRPGVYQMSFRGLTLREAWRFGKEPFKFTIALVLKLMAFKGARQWLPSHAAEEACEEADLSPSAREHLLPLLARARALGYNTGGFNRIARSLDPHTKEGFSHILLHRDGKRALFLGYILNDASGELKATVAVNGSLATAEYEDIEIVNHPNYLDATATSLRIRITGRELEDIDRALQDYMAKTTSQVRQFASYAAFKTHAKAMNDKNEEARVARGLYVYVGEQA